MRQGRFDAPSFPGILVQCKPGGEIYFTNKSRSTIWQMSAAWISLATANKQIAGDRNALVASLFARVGSLLGSLLYITCTCSRQTKMLPGNQSLSLVNVGTGKDSARGPALLLRMVQTQHVGRRSQIASLHLEDSAKSRMISVNVTLVK